MHLSPIATATLNGLSRQHVLASRARIFIVGAGAGDVGTLTLNALAAIELAEVIFLDSLVHGSILDLIPADVERVAVGKRAGEPSADQADIHSAMITAARAGRRVVRLKGGDPFIFGRGGEEAHALRAAGFEVEIVPGLTAALVCAASSGIPLTDRRYADRVTFITATTADGSTPDYAGLVGQRRTLVIYMGGRLAQQIAQQIIETAADSTTPVAVVMSGGRNEQVVLQTTLKELAEQGLQPISGEPTLLIIGLVVGEHKAKSSSAMPVAGIHLAHG